MPESPAVNDDDRPRGVFVYGTLRPGRANWSVAEPWCASHEPASLPGFGLYALAYPVVARLAGGESPEPGAGNGVRGDLLWLRPSDVEGALARLDAFEGVDHRQPERSYYERIHAEVVVAGGASRHAWVYVPGHALRAELGPHRRVPGDDWPP